MFIEDAVKGWPGIDSRHGLHDRRVRHICQSAAHLVCELTLEFSERPDVPP
jgi:hypothetical protein